MIDFSLAPVRAIRVSGGGGLEPSTTPMFQVPCFSPLVTNPIDINPFKITHPSHERLATPPGF